MTKNLNISYLKFLKDKTRTEILLSIDWVVTGRLNGSGLWCYEAPHDMSVSISIQGRV